MDVQLMVDSILPILGGLANTFQLIVISLLIGFCLAVGLALARHSRQPWLSLPARLYIFAIRGTPLLVQLFLIYYGLGQFDWLRGSFLWTFLREPFWCAILALTVNTTAYGAEIIRGGLQAVSWGERESARSFGMSGVLLFRRIVFPIAIRQALPAYGNEVILMVKATSLASTITVMEMTGVANTIISDTFKPLEIFLVAGVFYLSLNFVLSRVVKLIEYRMNGHLRPPPEEVPS